MVKEDAWNTRKDRFSFLGVPIKSPGGEHVRGVVYLDAQSPGFFDEETHRRRPRRLRWAGVVD